LAGLGRAREEFISIVSHELRTPVTGVMGFLQTTLDHWEELGELGRRRAVERALANARRLHALSRDVLDTATVEAEEMTYTFDVVDLVREVQSAVDAIAEVEPDRHVDVSRPNDPVWVRADAGRIHQ